MVEFKKYKEQKLKDESDKRTALLDEMAQISTELIEIRVLENDEKVNYQLITKRRNEEMEKLKDVSDRMNDEARSIRERWKKEGEDIFS